MARDTLPIRRRAARVGIVSAAALTALAWAPLSAFAGPAAVSAAAAGAGGHNGAQPQTTTRGATPADISGNMTYHGGTNDGTTTVGVMTGAPKVYIVYWGSQWGTATTDANGYTDFSTDTLGAAAKQQGLFKGLGTNSETWSGVMTQYCEGVAAGASTCPSGAAHVGYPSGGALAGVWYDNAAAEPTNATGHQLAQEAVNAAAHFGNTTEAANRNSMYIITSPFGTHPDGFTIGSGFCAWHSWNGDSAYLGSKGGTVSSSYGDIPFANMPGDIANASGCSGGGVNGFTAVNSHEYAETLTDTLTNFASNPTGGWFDSSGNENADKCQTDIGNLTLATGTFSVEPSWSNDDANGSGACSYSHPVVGGTGPSVSVTNPGNQTTTVGTPASLQIRATDTDNGALTYSATGLPAGLSVNAGSGLISGTPTTVGTSSVTVTAKDTTGPTGTASFTWNVTAAGTNTVTVADPGAQTSAVGAAASLQIKASDSATGQTLTYAASGLPAGLAINAASGLISGTPTAAGSSNVTVTATDTTKATGSTTFTWTVNPAGGGGGTVTVANPGSQWCFQGFRSLAIQISATDSKGLALTFTAKALPPGLTISAAGVISGTPTTAGTYTVTVTATDTSGGQGSTTFVYSIYS